MFTLKSFWFCVSLLFNLSEPKASTERSRFIKYITIYLIGLKSGTFIHFYLNFSSIRVPNLIMENWECNGRTCQVWQIINYEMRDLLLLNAFCFFLQRCCLSFGWAGQVKDSLSAFQIKFVEFNWKKKSCNCLLYFNKRSWRDRGKVEWVSEWVEERLLFNYHTIWNHVRFQSY